MEKIRRRTFEILQIGKKNDVPSRIFDCFIVVVIAISLFTTIFETFKESAPYHEIIKVVELITIIIFTIEYILRLWTADYLYPDKKGWRAPLAFALSFFGIIDLLTFFPYYLPFVFPSGVVAFRVFRVIRVFRLFKINTRYDAFNVIVDVLNQKKNQIFSSVVLILILMLASSLCMYSLEHEAQPDKFENAFSGMWWSVSTLLTVGYGDIYPITTIGKILAIIIAFLGVGVVAIPTGIISAGFVEHYQRLHTYMHHSEERDLKFVTSVINERHPWNGMCVKDLILPPQLLIVLIKRHDNALIPRGNLIITAGDTLIIGAKNFKEEDDINLREVIIKDKNPWVGKPVRELDISRQEIIVMIRRKNKVIIPNGSTIIMNGDSLRIYSSADKHDEIEEFEPESQVMM